MFKKLYIIVITIILTTLAIITTANAETIKREWQEALVLEWTPQVMLRGINALGCRTTVTVIIDSELRGRDYREVRESWVYDDLCLEQQIENEMEQKF